MRGDKAIVGYKEFIELCRVDDRNNFAGYRVEADGLYANVPTNDPALGSDDMAACVPWHPTGHYDKPALPLPCTLGQLRAFLPDAGMSGYIDEGAVDTVLGEREHTTGWYDCTMNAAMWLKRASVKPDEAAMLLWRLDPLERDWQGNTPDPERTYVDGDETSPDHYRAIKRAFEDVAETEPKPRTLLDWRDVAKREGLRHHQWIDEYVQAQIDELPPAPVREGGVPMVDGGGTAQDLPAIPGKLPPVAIGKLAITAAWNIQYESGRAATADKVIERLQKWADDGTYPDVLLKSDKKNRGVNWRLKKTGLEKSYDIGACGKTLETWMKSRDRAESGDTGQRAGTLGM